MAGVLIRRGNLDLDAGIKPHEDESRDQGDPSTSQRTSRIDSKTPEAKRGTRRKSANALISGFQPPEL